MNWTPETLARAFHETYGRVSPQFFGTKANAPSWDGISEQSRSHLIAVCADVLGIDTELPAVVAEELGEPVPEKVEFERARESKEEPEDALSDWEADLRRQIDEAARNVRSAKRPFDGRLR